MGEGVLVPVELERTGFGPLSEEGEGESVSVPLITEDVGDNEDVGGHEGGDIVPLELGILGRVERAE